MDADLKALEEKVARLIAQCQALREENVQLRQELARAQDDTRQLRDNMTQASARLEALIERLPVDVMSKESL
jgi:cell division protein ZapB